MMRRLLRMLGVRREIQRRLDVNLTFDDLEDAAGDVRNGARLALLSLMSWLDGAGEETNYQVEPEKWNNCSTFELPHAHDSELGQRCWLAGQTCDGHDDLVIGELVSRTQEFAQVGPESHALVGERITISVCGNEVDAVIFDEDSE